MITLTIAVTITAREQQEIFETYGDLVELCIDLANSQSTAEITVEDLNPANLKETT